MNPTLTPASAPAAPAPETHAPACLNCGTALHDQFCAHCGQNAHTHRFTLRHLLLHDLPHAVWHVDKGLLYTLRRMATQPGATIHEYLAGQRAQHFHPFSYLVILAAVSGLLLSALHLDPYAGVANVPPLLTKMMERYMSSLLKYPTAVYVLMLPLNALLLKWLLKPTRYNYAEMLVALCFINGTLTVLMLLLTVPLILIFGGTATFQYAGLLLLPVVMLYTGWVYLKMLAPTPISTRAKWLRAISASVLQMVSMFVLLLTYMIFIVAMLVREDPSLLKDFQAKAAARQHTTQPAPRR